MKIRESLALTFDDVLMVPQYSGICSRNAVSTTTRITPTIECAIPILSANMDTVTEASMAVMMARTGGLGIIHRFLSPERQAAEISRVKRSESYVVSEPLTVSVRQMHTSNILNVWLEERWSMVVIHCKRVGGGFEES